MKALITSVLAAGFMLGSALAKDMDIPVTELPKAVSGAIMKAHPDATLLSAEKDLKANGDVQHYQVKVRIGKDEKEVTVLPDGSIK